MSVPYSFASAPGHCKQIWLVEDISFLPNDPRQECDRLFVTPHSLN
jgi:hypothetical protein